MKSPLRMQPVMLPDLAGRFVLALMLLALLFAGCAKADSGAPTGLQAAQVDSTATSPASGSGTPTAQALSSDASPAAATITGTAPEVASTSQALASPSTAPS